MGAVIPKNCIDCHMPKEPSRSVAVQLQGMDVPTPALVIPSSQAYGAEGAGDLIPPYAPLVFEVELLNAE